VDAAVALGLKEAQKKLSDFVSRSELHGNLSVTATQGRETRTEIPSSNKRRRHTTKMDGV
jgi:hypothetical protein